MPATFLPGDTVCRTLCYNFQTTLDAGLLLYAVDLACRSGQLGNVTTLTAATVKPDGDIVTVQLQTDKVRLLLLAQTLGFIVQGQDSSTVRYG